jgi:hypothetical protein
MRPPLKTVPTIGTLLGSVVALVLVARTNAQHEGPPASAVRDGIQATADGVKGPTEAKATLESSGLDLRATSIIVPIETLILQAPRSRVRGSGVRTVGPGARNWTTGRRSPLHRPWLRARD